MKEEQSAQLFPWLYSIIHLPGEIVIEPLVRMMV